MDLQSPNDASLSTAAKVGPITTPHALYCLEPAGVPRLEVRELALPQPGRNEVLVEQIASAINPIDAKRAAGYGRRLLSLKGAGRFPLVLGNDVCGIVRASGRGAEDLPEGTRVFGLVPTRAAGAHASHVTVPRRWLRPLPEGVDAATAAALPYCFTTTWLALRQAGLTQANAAGRKVLVNGASGALGQIALHLLRSWGARVTAVASAHNLDLCRERGATETVARGPGALRRLSSDFSAVLNFGSWNDDAALSAQLSRGALGQATALHPLLGDFDRYGWLGGALKARAHWSVARALVVRRALSARYAWTVFKPDGEALDALANLLSSGLALTIGWSGPPQEAAAGFAHVSGGLPGRAVLRWQPA